MDTASPDSSGARLGHICDFFPGGSFFRIFGRPFEALRADDGVSRRDGCISAGGVRPRFAPRSPRDIWELLWELENFWKISQSVALKI